MQITLLCPKTGCFLMYCDIENAPSLAAHVPIIYSPGERISLARAALLLSSARASQRNRPKDIRFASLPYSKISGFP